MEYQNGKSVINRETGRFSYSPRIYTDFYTTRKEWKSLGNGKDNFMYQLRSAIVSFGLMRNYTGDDKIKLKNGLILNKLSFDRTGRRDGIQGEEYSAEIIKYVIKFMTHLDADVAFYSWKGTIDHVEITFGSYEEDYLPNIIVLFDSYADSSTNKILIRCMDALYFTLKGMKYKSHQHQYNSAWDIIFNYSEHDSHYSHYDFVSYEQALYRDYNHYGEIEYWRDFGEKDEDFSI